ncbi:MULTISPECIES: ATP-binding protein [unclassified Streptomyces]|uniref:ATP-binding protein n=1 Tax=Streptomyces evansiae TaxID=3075535 RepID=A0ABU2R6E0_9ACTN|nr:MULTISPECIES: ATP-binding protein [unclassified Streptomyces]MDT0411952.1 ATP-binding protein [Streptomyces sp. DSM 41979]MDT0421872.1 ATP-binding protein [Streptomyces sp. DSM 41859]WEH28310.1 ATP-binding protein [Streptomyces sp. AM 3-1-1]SCE36860.1 Anti-sigma regulatory factor (Ser/Thr protein kinase) [Streptomyces sp. DfronAA-171]
MTETAVPNPSPRLTHHWSGEFRPAEISAPEARNTVRRLLNRWGWEGDLDAALLITTELMANAVRHAGAENGGSPPLVLRVDVEGEHLLLEVSDCAPYFTPAPRTDEEAESGRGLLLIKCLGATLSWAPQPSGAGKRVTVRLAGRAKRG